MFKWSHPTIKGTFLFPDTVVAPPIVRIRIHQPPPKPDTGSPLIAIQKPNSDVVRKSLTLIAKKILDRERANIVQWSLSQRQNNSLGDMKVVKTQARFNGVDAFYSRSHEKEQLDLTVFPEPPIEKPEGDLQLLILHDTNRITAVSMKALDGATRNGFQNLSATYRADLKQSSWDEDLIKSSQYKFDTVLGTMLFSPIVVNKDNVISKAEKHHLCALVSRLTHFVESNTLATRTPRFNGEGGVYYTPNDVFALQREGSTTRLARTGEGGNGAFPYAITADGAYYYAPMSVGPIADESDLPIPGVLLSIDPFEQHATANIWGWKPTLPFYFGSSLDIGNVLVSLTDDAMDVFETTAYSAVNLPVDTLRYAGPSHGYVAPIEDILQTLIQPTVDNSEFHWANTGYGTWVNNEYIITVNNTVSERINTPPYYGTTSDPDHSQSLPVTIFQQNENIDVVSVVFTPVTATSTEIYNDTAGTYFYLKTLEMLHYQFRYGVTESENIGEAYNYTYYSFYRDLVWTTFPDNPGGYAWLVSYPPSLSLEDGGYYFADNHVLRTPYGKLDAPLDWRAKHYQSLMMWKRYIPWVHLSNGVIVIQGFELLEDRHVWYRGPKVKEVSPTPVEITDILTAIAETEITNIQALIIDVPLARIREFV